MKKDKEKDLQSQELEQSPSSPVVLCAVQPIFDGELNYHGHDVLFREAETKHVQILDGDRATSKVLIDNFSSVQLGSPTKVLPCFVTVTASLLRSGYLPETMDGCLVYKFSLQRRPDAKFVECLQGLAANGMALALSGADDLQCCLPLLPYLRYVKLDVSVVDMETVAKKLAILRGFDIAVIAEKIESAEQFSVCKSFGFDGYQGFFLTKPQIVKGRVLDPSSQLVLQLLEALEDPDITPERIDELVSQDAAMGFKLLRIISSAAYALPRKIESVKDVVVILGLDHIRRWVAMIALTSLDVKSNLFLPMQLVRAKMCEHIAETMQLDNPRKYFMAGLFSLLDAMLDMEMAELLTHLPLDQELVAALTVRSGQLGEVLAAVIAYQQADWSAVDGFTVEPSLLKEAYLQGVIWSEDVLMTLSDHT